MARSGYAKGANKGHVTEQKERPARPAAKKMVRLLCTRNTERQREIWRKEGKQKHLVTTRIYFYTHTILFCFCSFVFASPPPNIGCFQTYDTGT
jgi:hypothetical protein